jgi:hypothetical protein
MAATPGKSNNAENRVERRLGKVNPETKVDGKEAKTPNEKSFFDVYQRELENPEDKDDVFETTIAGNKFAIALQASMLDATWDLFRHVFKKIKASGDSNPDKIKRSGHPEVRLFFFEKRTDVTLGYTPLKGEISFDLMNLVDSSTLTKDSTNQLIKESDIKQLSAKTRAVFTPSFKWERGKKMVVYHDWARGYDFKIMCKSETEGVRIATEILKIQGHTLRSEFLKLNQLIGTSKPTIPIPKEENVLGKKRKHKRYRPEGTVYYSYATLHLPSYGQKIPLG